MEFRWILKVIIKFYHYFFHLLLDTPITKSIRTPKRGSNHIKKMKQFVKLHSLCLFLVTLYPHPIPTENMLIYVIQICLFDLSFFHFDFNFSTLFFFLICFSHFSTSESSCLVRLRFSLTFY